MSKLSSEEKSVLEAYERGELVQSADAEAKAQLLKRYAKQALKKEGRSNTHQPSRGRQKD